MVRHRIGFGASLVTPGAGRRVLPELMLPGIRGERNGPVSLQTIFLFFQNENRLAPADGEGDNVRSVVLPSHSGCFLMNESRDITPQPENRDGSPDPFPSVSPPAPAESAVESPVESTARDTPLSEKLPAGINEAGGEGVGGEAAESVGTGWRKLDPRQVALERVGGLIFFGVVFVGSLVGLVIWWLTAGLSLGWWIGLGAGVLLNGLLLWSALWWPAIAHRHAQWRLDETGLEIHRGVFWRHQLAVPLARLQHADVLQGPLQRRFGLGKLTVHTAGTANASVELDGLAFETASWLRDQLIRQRETLDVV